MSEPPLCLQVRIPANGDGFVWRPGEWAEGNKTCKGSVLVERQDRVFDDYFPADEPIAFYRELADVEPTEAGVLRFANRYGALWGLHAKQVDGADVPGSDLLEPSVRAEPLRDWVEVIEEMHEAVVLWDMARVGDARGLSEVLEWREGRVNYLGTPRYRAWRQAKVQLPSLDDPEESARIRSDVSDAELLHESKFLNEPYVRKNDLIVPAILRVFWVVNLYVHAPNGPVGAWDARRNKPARQDVSSNLGGYAWLQLLEAVVAGKEPRRCEQCGRWFEVAHGASRTDRLLCSDTCRTRAYRGRKERAARLRGEGKTVKQIAKELGSDEKTVQGWFKSSKKKEK